jgi:hypothetical protein
MFTKFALTVWISPEGKLTNLTVPRAFCGDAGGRKV